MNLRGVGSLVTVAVAAIVLAACGGGTTSQEPTAVAVVESQTSDPATPEPAEPTPTPEPTPTILPITSDDLTDALPTNPMLSKVQGFTFKENKRWTEGDGEGPEWVADSPLTKEQRMQVGIGALRRIKPDRCEARAAFSGEGWTNATAAQGYFKAAGYAKKVNADRYFRTNKVDQWQTVALLLPEGAAQVWTTNLAATIKECQRYTLIAEDGDVSKRNWSKISKNWSTTWRKDAGAVVQLADYPRPAARFVYVWEPIGSILYRTSITIHSDNDNQWSRASKLYNRLANNVAKAQGVQREPVDLLGGVVIKPNPADYTPPPKPTI